MWSDALPSHMQTISHAGAAIQALHATADAHMVAFFFEPGDVGLLWIGKMAPPVTTRAVSLDRAWSQVLSFVGIGGSTALYAVLLSCEVLSFSVPGIQHLYCNRA